MGSEMCIRDRYSPSLLLSSGNSVPAGCHVLQLSSLLEGRAGGHGFKGGGCVGGTLGGLGGGGGSKGNAPASSAHGVIMSSAKRQSPEHDCEHVAPKSLELAASYTVPLIADRPTPLSSTSPGHHVPLLWSQTNEPSSVSGRACEHTEA